MKTFKKILGSNLFRSFSVYVFSGLLNSAVSFLLLPLFTKYLSTEDYGKLSMFNTVIALLTVLIMVGVDGSVRREYFDLKGRRYSSYFSSSALITFVSFIIVTSLTWIFIVPLVRLTELDSIWLYIGLLISFLSVFPTLLSGQYRVENNAKLFALLNNSLTIVNLILGVIFVAMLKWNFEGRAYSLLITNIIFAVISIILLQRKNLVSKQIKTSNIKSSLNYGIPSIPHKLGALLINFADKFFIVSMVGMSANGLYNVGYTVGSLVGKLEGAFSLAFTPILFEELKKNNFEAKVKLVKITYLFIGGLFIASLLLVASSRLLYGFLIDDKFASSIVLVPVVAASYFFSGCYKMFAGYIFYSKKTILLTYLAVVNIIVNLALNYYLIRHYGIMGAAYATFISFLIMFVLTVIISQRLIPMPWFYFLKRSQNEI